MITSKAPSDFVLGVDLDGVVADFILGLRPIAAEWLGKPIDALPLEVSYGFPEWNLNECGGYEALHRYAVKERNLFRELPPLPDAAKTLRKLASLGLRIRIITHRLYIEWFHRQAIFQTVDWLEQHDIPYWDICFMKQKSAVGANLYLEDNAENVNDLRTHGCEVIVVANSTNRQVLGPRATSWLEIEHLVRTRFEAWLDPSSGT
jgi:5'(3')-deoxyribonucleotidase